LTNDSSFGALKSEKFFKRALDSQCWVINMEKSKALTRDSLISMQVIDAEGRLVGKVKDLAFSVGRSGISLSVENEAGENKNVAWEEVQAASDFIILKPAASYAQVQQSAQTSVEQPQQQTQPSQPLCPTCNKPLTFIQQYQRWYCYNDKKYV
jgi:sporulation protein YlmC with PRC-barrel domain